MPWCSASAKANLVPTKFSDAAIPQGTFDTRARRALKNDGRIVRERELAESDEIDHQVLRPHRTFSYLLVTNTKIAKLTDRQRCESSSWRNSMKKQVPQRRYDTCDGRCIFSFGPISQI